MNPLLVCGDCKDWGARLYRWCRTMLGGKACSSGETHVPETAATCSQVVERSSLWAIMLQEEQQLDQSTANYRLVK